MPTTKFDQNTQKTKPAGPKFAPKPRTDGAHKAGDYKPRAEGERKEGGYKPRTGERKTFDDNKRYTTDAKPVIVRKSAHDSASSKDSSRQDDSFAVDKKPKAPKIKHNANQFYATGKRKTSVARVWIVRGGKGSFAVNSKTMEVYFPRLAHQSSILKPFSITNVLGNFDVKCTVKGGGISGQAEAIRLGIAKALLEYDPDFRIALRAAKLLTRDSRIVERKKYGQHKARKSTQFSKR